MLLFSSWLNKTQQKRKIKLLIKKIGGFIFTFIMMVSVIIWLQQVLKMAKHCIDNVDLRTPLLFLLLTANSRVQKVTKQELRYAKVKLLLMVISELKPTIMTVSTLLIMKTTLSIMTSQNSKKIKKMKFKKNLKSTQKKMQQFLSEAAMV